MRYDKRPHCIASWSQFRAELAPDGMAPTLTAGAVAIILVVIESVSYASLIFSGNLASYIGMGISITLTSAVVCGLITAIFSSYPGAVAFSQNKIAAIFALIAAATFAAATPSRPADQAIFCVAAAIFISTVMTGAVLAALGVFKLGSLTRFVPYPVVCGFLASVGWLLVLGSLKTMTGVRVTFATVPAFLRPDLLAHWLPGLAFALAAYVLLPRIKHYAVMPALMATAVLIFYAWLFASGTSLDDARLSGWLIHTAATGDLSQIVTVEAFARADWGPIIGQAGEIGTVVVLSIIGLLLNSSAVGLAAEQELDLDRELNVAGAANIVGGLIGGMVGFTSINLSKLVLNIGVRGRLVGVLCALGCAAILVFGTELITYFPKPLLGGLLLFIGIDFLIEWVYKSARELPRTDLVIVLIILVVAGFVDFFPGIMVGVILAFVIFVIRYSGVEVIKQAFSGADRHSNVERSPEQTKFLERQGQTIQVFKLTGFVFFASANNLLNRSRQRMEDPNQSDLRYLVCDFRAVSGIDSSAIISLARLGQLARGRGITVILTNLSETVTRQIENAEILQSNPETWRIFANLDYAVEWCEDQLLDSQEQVFAKRRATLREYFVESKFRASEFALLVKYLVRYEMPAEHVLIKQGQPPDALYFIESGLVTVRINVGEGVAFRVRKMGAGTVVGEIGLYLDLPRTADVITQEPCVIYGLSRENMNMMERNDPTIASIFHEFMVRLLAERLVHTDRLLQALLD
jgi:SulP family sulfate permease